MQNQFWRAEIKQCQTPEQALATLENFAGLDKGRAILQMRLFRPDLYNLWREKPPQFKSVENPGLSRFNFIGR